MEIMARMTPAGSTLVCGIGIAIVVLVFRQLGQPALPTSEEEFCATVDSYSDKYRAASGNEIHRESLAKGRAPGRSHLNLDHFK
jgi:hypothetical protein